MTGAQKGAGEQYMRAVLVTPDLDTVQSVLSSQWTYIR